MKQSSIIITLILFVTFNSFAQESNGSVNSLIAAENYFSAFANEKGLRNGFLKVSDDETLVFRPGPVKSTDFYDKKQEDPGSLSWEPAFAKISRGGDWGFTTGPYVYTSNDGSNSYGQYLSVWQANKKRVWKLALDIGTPHGKPEKEIALSFIDAKNSRFFRQVSQTRLKQREDMIMTTDRLFSNTLRKNTITAYDAFLGDDARLLFPGFEPIVGKENINKFYTQNQYNIVAEPLAANRSIGSDLAYTYGTAQITKNDKTARYNYVRIWESQEGYKWNVVVELFSPAE
jgi:ketosteroid isomerase-like protein